ncbi:MAG: hypothetical protein M3362_28130, partial [Acidobacteriota bacterium]|nr:hypothetical protein [Acidobacteriota bacterium]
PLAGDPDISSEIRTLNTYFDDLLRFDKECAAAFRKASLTSEDVAALDRKGQDLKNRLSGVKSALQGIEEKLKAANQWSGLDARLLGQITDASAQARFRANSFTKTIEEARTQLAQDDITGALEALHKKASGQAQDANALSFRLSNKTKCRLAYLRYGFSSAFSSSGRPSTSSVNDVSCYCDSNPEDCSFNKP